MEFSNSTYDRLKWWAQIGLPAFVLFLSGLVTLCNIPNGEIIVGVVALFNTFLGNILKRSSDSYQDGELVVDNSDPLKDIYSIVLPDYPEQLSEKDKVVLKVSRPAHMAGVSTEE